MTVPSTLLSIDGIELGDYATRALTMTLAPIEQTRQVHRTINGGLIDLSHTQFRKYKATISCDDQESPVLADVWPGQLVTVVALSQLIGPDPVTMTMMVTAPWASARKEWDAQTSWQLELEQTDDASGLSG